MPARKIKTMAARGFSLIELVLVISIIAIMSAAVYSNYSAIDNRGKILSVTSKIKDDLSLAQNFSLSGKLNKIYRPNGWGVNFNRNLNKYTVFSDLNNSKTYDYPIKILIHGNETVSSNTFNESSNSAFAVTVVNAVQTMSAGRPTSTTGYWDFDGTTDYLTLVDNGTFDTSTNNFNIDFWFNSSSSGSQRYLFCKGNGIGTKTFEIYKDASDKLMAVVYDTSGTAYTLNGSSRSAISAGQWYHVALVRSGTTLVLYLNGAVWAKAPLPSSATAIRATSIPVFIGSDDTGAYSWKGSIDEIRYFIGNGWRVETFTPPTVAYDKDAEILKNYRLPPGLVFERLYAEATTTNELNIYFNPTAYTAWANAAAIVDSAKIKVNNAGAEASLSSSDAPKLLKVMPSGLVKWSTN
jgi:prepilin-type N-terminal cleavage/methylation domain-containing protein